MRLRLQITWKACFCYSLLLKFCCHNRFGRCICSLYHLRFCACRQRMFRKACCRMTGFHKICFRMICSRKACFRRICSRKFCFRQFFARYLSGFLQLSCVWQLKNVKDRFRGYFFGLCSFLRRSGECLLYHWHRYFRRNRRCSDGLRAGRGASFFSALDFSGRNSHRRRSECKAKT